MHLRCHAVGDRCTPSYPRAASYFDARGCGDSQRPPNHSHTLRHRRHRERQQYWYVEMGRRRCTTTQSVRPYFWLLPMKSQSAKTNWTRARIQRDPIARSVAGVTLVSVLVNFWVINLVTDLLIVLLKLISYWTRDLSLTPTMWTISE